MTATSTPKLEQFLSGTDGAKGDFKFSTICFIGAENPNGRWRVYSFEELIARDKASLDIFWLKDTLTDSDNLQAPELIAQEIVDDLEAAMEQFRPIAGDLAGEVEDAA